MLVLLAGLYCLERVRATQQKLAITENIIANGGELIYEFPTFKSNVRHYVGREKYSRIRGVQFENKTEFNFDFAQLDRLQGFRSLHFFGGNVDDRTVNKILGLKKLRRLSLCDVKISIEGLESITQLQQLERVDVRGTQLPPEVLARWKIDLANTEIVTEN